MKSRDQILLEEAYLIVSENRAIAKQYVDQGKLSQENFDNILEADPSKQKKYVGWMAKQWMNNGVNDIDLLRNTIEEFDSFANRGKTKNKDLYQYKSFEEVKKEVDYLNQTGQNVSSKDLEGDFDVIKDDENLLIMSPHTHEASRKLGLSHFAYRNCGEGGKDSAWCTTYKASNHFNDYYHKHNVTFLYIKVRSKEILKTLKQAKFGPEFGVVALALLGQEMEERAKEKGFGNMDAYDALDKQFKGAKLQKYLDILGVNFEPQHEETL